MALITQTIIETLHEQIKKRGTTVWYDPDRDYESLVEKLVPDDLGAKAIFRYRPERGFLGLRHDMEPYWGETTTPPPLLIYVPLERAETNNALIEYEVAGVVLRPGQQPPAQNTALAAVAGRALRQVFPEAAVAELVAQVEAGQLSLVELDHLAESGLEARTGALSVIFDTGNDAEIALRFLTEPELDTEIEERQAQTALAGLLSNALGVDFRDASDLSSLRARLARQLLVTEHLQTAFPDEGNVPAALQTFPLAERKVAREAAANLARSWRNRRDLSESYVQWSQDIAKELGPQALDLPLQALTRTHTFAAAESYLQAAIEQALLQRPAASLAETAERRRQQFWATQDPSIKTRWEVIAAAGRVLVEAARLERALKGTKWTAGALLARYAYGDEGSDPWCTLDTAQRHLERDFHRFELDLARHGTLTKLVARARQCYAAAADRLAETFTDAYEAADFDLPEVTLQTDIFRDHVSPAVKQNRTAYVLVDALRFEMARELLAALDDTWDTRLMFALATPPTVTEVGMAALMPGAENGVAVTDSRSGLAITVAGVTLKSRDSRVSHFVTTVDGAAVVKLDQLAPLSNRHTADKLQEANVILVTATEDIDGLFESNPNLARRLVDEAFIQLRRGIKTLFAVGIHTVIVTADHGYLFGEDLYTGEGMDTPGGHKVVLKRRVWVGQGGADVPGTLRRPLSAFGVGGKLELVTPRNLAYFKVPGGSFTYFHGGLSLQELVVPILSVHAGPRSQAADEAQFDWNLTLGSKGINTRTISVTVSGRTSQLFAPEPPLVRVEVRANDQPISEPVLAKYGFDDITRDVQLEIAPDDERAVAENFIVLAITDVPDVDNATIHLLDASTGVSLARLENVPLDIAL